MEDYQAWLQCRRDVYAKIMAERRDEDEKSESFARGVLAGMVIATVLYAAFNWLRLL